MTRPRRSLRERIIAADVKVGRLLANATEARWKGNEKQARRLEEAAQKALDLYNKLSGNN